MNRETAEYIARLPESVRDFAESVATGAVNVWGASVSTESEREAIRAAIQELKQFAGRGPVEAETKPGEA